MTLLFSPFPSGDLAEWAGRFKGEPNPRAERNEDGAVSDIAVSIGFIPLYFLNSPEGEEGAGAFGGSDFY